MTGVTPASKNALVDFVGRARRAVGYLRAAPFDLVTSEGRSQERYRLIAVSGAAAITAKVAAAAAGIALVPMVVHHVGKDQFGLWMVVSSLVVWMQLADFGIANGLSNALAEAHGRDDRVSAGNYLSSALAATLALVLLCLPLLAAAYTGLQWDRILKIDDAVLAELATDALLLVGLAFVINIPLSLVSRVLVAYQRGYVASISQAAATVLSFAGMAIAVYVKAGLLWLVGIAAFAPVLVNLALWLALPRAIGHLRLGISGVTRAAVSRVAASSVPLFFFQCGALLLNQLVNVVIARTESLSVVTDYNVILRIYLFVFAIAAALSSPFYAAIREAFEKREAQWVVRAVRHSLSIRVLSTLPFALVLLVAGDLIVRLWIGKTMAAPIGFVGWACVCVSLVLAASSSLLSEVLSSLDDIWSQVGIVLLSAATVLILMTTLIPRMGVAGVFLAMAASTLYPIGWSYRRLGRKLAGA